MMNLPTDNNGETVTESRVNESHSADNKIEKHNKTSRLRKLYDRRWKKILLGIISVLIIIVLTAVCTYSIMWNLGKKALLDNTNASIVTPNNSEILVDDDGTVIYNGEKYIYNESVTSILVMGVDKKEESDYVTGFKGQADAIFLVVIDTSTGKTTVVSVSRDIMAEVPVRTKDGAYVGIETHQICTAYAYGDGAEKSCDNMVTAVSRLMYGIPINSYFCMDWTAITVLNDMVGGVTVPAYDSDWNPTGGTVTLSGQKALDYIQKRNREMEDSNGNRMDRQINYLKAFAEKTIKKMKSDITVPLKMYNTLNKYSTNNIDASRITFLATLFMNGGANISFEKIRGEVVQGEKFAEMYVDEDALYNMVLELFYTKQQ